MGKTYLADDVTLDSVWLRRIRGKLDAAEIEKAKQLADEDVRVWLRQLYGSEADSREDLETILDTDGLTPLDVGATIIGDLFHKDVDGFLDRLSHPDYVRLVQVAELTASYYLIQWGDFMGDAPEAEGSSQQITIANSLRRMKLEVERLGSLITTADAEVPDTRFFFQRVTVLNRTGIYARRKARR